MTGDPRGIIPMQTDYQRSLREQLYNHFKLSSQVRFSNGGHDHGF